MSGMYLFKKTFIEFHWTRLFVHVRMLLWEERKKEWKKNIFRNEGGEQIWRQKQMNSYNFHRYMVDVYIIFSNQIDFPYEDLKWNTHSSKNGSVCFPAFFNIPALSHYSNNGAFVINFVYLCYKQHRGKEKSLRCVFSSFI